MLTDKSSNYPRPSSPNVEWFKYPNRTTFNAIAAALTAIVAPVLPLAVGVLILKIFGFSPSEINTEKIALWAKAVGIFGWGILIYGNVPRAYSYVQKFSLHSQGLTRKVLTLESQLSWSEISYIENRRQPTFENYRWVEETCLVIKGKEKSFIVYGKLEDFGLFKESISNFCRAASIPQFFVDRTYETLGRLKAENPTLYHKVKRKGLRAKVDHL